MRPAGPALGLLALGLLALAAGCTARDPLAPPEIRYGEDVCAECGMIISEPRFAAGLVLGPAGGEALAFDDIGDMLAWARAHPEAEVSRWWVHDYASEAWLDARAASFVRAKALRTPMDHGLAAFAEPGAAAAMAAELGGEVLGFAALAASAAVPDPLLTPPVPEGD